MMSVLAIICVISTVLIVIIYQKTTNAICDSKKRLDGKTALITGGARGLGYEIAKGLALRGAKVIITSSDLRRGNDAKHKIIKETGNIEVYSKHLDLSSLKSARQLADNVLKTEDRLDILINNSGTAKHSNVSTSDGLNYVMQVNYYGAFLLTLLLLPILRASGKPGDASRILIISGALHVLGKMTTENKKTLVPNFILGIKLGINSKANLVGFVSELTKKLKDTNVIINNVDPGIVGTNFLDYIHEVVGVISKVIVMVMFKTPWQGAQTVLFAALDQKAGEVSGVFFKNCKIKRAVKPVDYDIAGKLLWQETVKLVKLTKEELHRAFNVASK